MNVGMFADLLEAKVQKHVATAIENLGLKNENDPYAYKIQKLGKKYPFFFKKWLYLNQKDMMSSLSGKSRNSLQS